jgi:tetratricopeptide (TPR) repeat protein
LAAAPAMEAENDHPGLFSRVETRSRQGASGRRRTHLMAIEIFFSRIHTCALAGLIAIALAGCQTPGDAGPEITASTPIVIEPDTNPIDFSTLLPTETFRLRLQHFERGEYGLSEEYFRRTVEKTPDNVEAWIGLAASYDRIKRFDLADRAYASAIRLVGETTQILNNQGYSYMLRADFLTARAKLNKAYRRDPGNPTVINNLRILNASDPGSGGHRG